MILAYQTDRNELVGLARVSQSVERDTNLYLKPIEIIGIRVRPLKKADPRIAAIPALRPGPIKTLYEISEPDAHRLLKAAGADFADKTESTSHHQAKEELIAENNYWDISALEGERQLAKHFRIERNSRLVKNKKKQVFKKIGALQCEACGFDFRKTYGELGKGFCEVHHKKPLSGHSRRMRTTLNDLAILCSNCHRMIHRKKTMLSIDELKRRLQSINI